MKKIVVSFISVLFALSMGITSTLASVDETKIKDSYTKAQTYYMNNGDVLYSADDVIAIQQLGIDVKANFTLFEDILKQDFTTMPAGTLAKHIIAFSIMGIDAKDVNGSDLITILESYVNEEGAIVVSNTEVAAPNYAVYCLYALEVVSSTKIEKVADYLAQMQLENGSFWYEYEGKIADESTTGWVIEALTLANKQKYQSTIEKAIAFLNGVQQNDGSWGMWGASADTQAAVLQGLIAYDIAGVKAGNYDKNGVSPFDTLLSLQDTTGWFGYIDFMTNEFTKSALTTFNASTSIGSYFNGSFVLNAKKAYETLHQKEEVQPEITPPLSKGPATSDESNAQIYGGLALLAMMILLGRKYAQA